MCIRSSWILSNQQNSTIKESNRQNIIHKRLPYNIKQIKKSLQDNNLTIARADKSKAMVIIDKTDMEQKINNFISENNIMELKKDPATTYHKRTQQLVKKCTNIIERSKSTYMLNIKPEAPKLNAYIKTHKSNEPIRLVIDNTLAPAYKLAKYLNNKMKDYIDLPKTYAINNSKELAGELKQLHIGDHHRMITMDIKDLYVNLPKQGRIQSTTTWLERNKVYKEDKEQILQLLKIIIEQNYFQHNNKYYKPTKGIAVGSPISGTLAEIYLQLLEEHHVKHWIENGDLFYYKRYVDDILIIIDTIKTDENILENRMNNIDNNLEFKIMAEPITRLTTWI